MEDRVVLELLIPSKYIYLRCQDKTRGIRTDEIRSNMLLQIKRDLKSTNAFLSACSGSSIKAPAAIVRRLDGLPTIDMSLDIG